MSKYSELADRLGSLYIIDEVSSNNTLAKEAAAALRELEAENIRRGDQLVRAASKIHDHRKRATEAEARIAELEASRSLLPNMPISGAMRREWERYMLRPFDSAAEDAFRAMLRAAPTEKPR